MKPIAEIRVPIYQEQDNTILTGCPYLYDPEVHLGEEHLPIICQDAAEQLLRHKYAGGKMPVDEHVLWFGCEHSGHEVVTESRRQLYSAQGEIPQLDPGPFAPEVSK